MQIHPHAHAIGGHAEPSAILRISLPPTTTEQLNKQLTKIAASPSQYSNAAAYKSMVIRTLNTLASSSYYAKLQGQSYELD